LNRALISTALVFPLAATTRPASDLTVVLDFQGARSERAILEMQREVGTILKASGVQLEWRTRSEASRESFNDLVLVRFSGTCDLGIASQGLGKRGPLGSTFISDGSMLPFAEIACDRVGDAVRSAMSGDDFEMADVLLGRALGRVLAHEVVHMLSKSGEHGRAGVAKTSLSGSQLIAPELRLGAADLERMHGHIPSIK